MNNQRSLLLLLMIVSACAGGGCSAFVAGGGKNIAETMSENSSRKKIEAMTGKPTSEERLATAVIPPKDLIVGNQENNPAPAKSIATYEYHGRADDLIEFQDLGMLDGMTLGLGEVIAFPMSLIRSAELAKVVHHYRVWYSADDHCVAFTADPK